MGDKNALGPHGEAFAWELLRKRGDKLVTRNFSCPQGELDIVSWHGATLVFTEVRARSSVAFGTPAETVTRSKQQKVIRAAQWFCAKTIKGQLPPCRFDMIWLLCKHGKVVESGIIEAAFQ